MPRNPFRLDNQHPFTGWHMLAVTALFFAVIIGVNGVLAFVAGGTFPGLVVRNSYVASQKYNELLTEARAQARTGWQLEVSAAGGVIEARVLDVNGVPQTGLSLTALAARPSSAGEDRILHLTAIPYGYRADATLAPGQWALDIEARRRDELVFRETRRVFVPAGGA
jgi:nitrogen fixation protein FixH